MTVYWVEELKGIGCWGNVDYKKISPLYDSKSKAENWAKENNISLEKGPSGYDRYQISHNTIN